MKTIAQIKEENEAMLEKIFGAENADEFQKYGNELARCQIIFGQLIHSTNDEEEIKKALIVEYIDKDLIFDAMKKIFEFQSAEISKVIEASYLKNNQGTKLKSTNNTGDENEKTIN